MTPLTWRSRTTVLAEPEHVIDTLTDTEACARWSPIPFTVDDNGSDRLLAGTICRVSGRLLGAPIRFRLHTLEADTSRLRLHARGPIEIRVVYSLRPVGEGCHVDARVSIQPSRSRFGRLIGRATGLLLTDGTLDDALKRIAREAERSAQISARSAPNVTRDDLCGRRDASPRESDRFAVSYKRAGRVPAS
jgi:Polyketide cyclase / dehydrase and lipid transport